MSGEQRTDHTAGPAFVPAPLLDPTFIRAYHFLPTKFALTDIALGRMKVSRFADLNDPFELLAANLGPEKIRNAVRGFKQDLDEKTGLLCFSKGWGDPVLWSHYAEKHHGMCLGFDIRRDFAMPVAYEPERILPKIDGINGPHPSADPAFVRALLTTKYVNWRYEQEIRVFVGLDESTQEKGLFYYSFSPDLALREVILGHYCEVPLESVRKLFREADNVQVIKATLAYKSFTVVPEG